MLLSEISETGIAALITGIGAAGLGIYALFRKTIREQKYADADLARKTDSDNADYWLKHYEKFETKIVATMDELRAEHKKIEKELLTCREEHAQSRGERAALRTDLTAKEARIAHLEKVELAELRRDMVEKEKRIAELERLLGGRDVNG